MEPIPGGASRWFSKIAGIVARSGTIAFWYSPTDATMLDVDWSATDALMRFLTPPSFTVTQPSVFR